MTMKFNKQRNLLPIHPVTWEEILDRFGTNYYRKQILRELKSALYNFKSSGCMKVFLDGSFITAKLRPGDFDGCWDPKGVDVKQLDPVLQDLSNDCKAQKIKYSGEFFPITNSPENILNFFQYDKDRAYVKESYRLIWSDYHDQKRKTV